ncbi:MAG: hypothetical protein R2827_06030 [Bdellovibrionales bacterium]
MTGRFRLATLFFFSVFYGGYAISVTSDGSTTSPPSENAKEEASRFGLSSSLEYRSNLYGDGEFEKATHLGFDITSTYKISKNFITSARAAISKDLVGPGDVSLSNLRLRVSQSAYPVGLNFKMSPRISLYMPTNEVSRQDKRYFGGLAAGLLFVSEKPVIGLDIQYGLSLKKDFHEFETDNLNQELVEWGLTNGLTFGMPFGDRWRIEVSGSYQSVQTYRGTLKSLFILDESLSYNINEKMSLVFGHTNEGNAFQYDGVTNNIGVYDEKTSTLYMALNFSN